MDNVTISQEAVADTVSESNFLLLRESLLSQRGTPTWELALKYPLQGNWTETDYLALEHDGLVEYSNGVLEFLPMPTWLHQFIVAFLYSSLDQFVKPRSLGFTAFAPLPVWIGEGLYREPDIVFAKASRMRGLKKPPEGADLVIEVVSDSKEARDRDFVKKRIDYATGGIPEYWIVDPAVETITVLILVNGEYQVHGEFHPGTSATSVLLPGFEVNVKSCFEAGRVEAGEDHHRE